MFKYYKNDKEFEQDKAIEEMTDYIFGNIIPHDTQFKEDCRSIARDLICEGYRKLPENSVVLTREECQELTVCRLNNEKASEVLLHFENVEKRIRKEMAEKFAEMVKMAFYYEFDELIPSIMADKIDEICKEITEGK